MKIENLTRANQITTLLPQLKEHLFKWENAVGLNIKIDASFNSKGSGFSYVNTKFIPFDVIRILSIDGFTKEIAALEKEFESL